MGTILPEFTSTPAMIVDSVRLADHESMLANVGSVTFLVRLANSLCSMVFVDGSV